MIGGTQSSVASKFGDTLYKQSGSLLQQDSIFDDANRAVSVERSRDASISQAI